MRRLTTEERLILLLSRPDPSPEDLESAEGLLTDGRRPIDHDRFLKLAGMNSVSPLIYRNTVGFRSMPEKVADELKRAYLLTFGRNVFHAGKTMKIIGMFRGEGIEVVPLKGSLASDMILGDMGLYPTGDIDLLVRAADLGRAKRILADAGFAEAMGLAEEDLLESNYHLIFDDGICFVEVHWNLVKWAFKAAPDFWWEGTTVVKYEGEEIRLLSPERYLIYAIFHLFTHRFAPLKFHILACGIIKKYRDRIDWDELLSSAADIGMKRLTIFTLRLLNDVLGTEIPAHIKSEKIAGYSILTELVLSGLFRDVTRTYVRLAAFTTLLDTPRDTVRVLLSRVFPSLSEIRLRYHLPLRSRKVWLYYLANPVLLLLKKR